MLLLLLLIVLLLLLQEIARLQRVLAVQQSQLQSLRELAVYVHPKLGFRV